MERRRIVIPGAAGRDFHDFPPELSGPRYADGIAIRSSHAEGDAPRLAGAGDGGPVRDAVTIGSADLVEQEIEEP